MTNINKIFLFFIILILSKMSYAVDTRLTIKGMVWDNTCEVSINSQNFIVDFGPNSLKNFLDLNRRSSKHSFNITLSRCGDSTKGAYVTFKGVQNSENNSYLKIDDFPGAANGVAIIIENDKNQLVPINKKNSFQISLLPSRKNVINFNAYLVATKLPVKTGKITSRADFLFEYI